MNFSCSQKLLLDTKRESEINNLFVEFFYDLHYVAFAWQVPLAMGASMTLKGTVVEFCIFY